MAPHFYNGNVEQIRDTGSDTTIFMMQKIADLFTGAGLYGCTLNADNADQLQQLGSGPLDCQRAVLLRRQLQHRDQRHCGQLGPHRGRPAGLTTLAQVRARLSSAALRIRRFRSISPARRSRPGSISGCPMVGTGYAKDGVLALDYPVNPSTSEPRPSPPTRHERRGRGSGGAGWLPGDPNGGPYTGTKFTAMANINGPAVAATARRTSCGAHHNGSSATRISDWGQLTNIGPEPAVDGVSAPTARTTVTIHGWVPLDGRVR